MAWSNNAENIYSFRINRVEPLYIPCVARCWGRSGTIFLWAASRAIQIRNSPWVHAEMFSFRPTANFEFGFQRTIIWGGEGHVPVTLHTFFKSFFEHQRYSGRREKFPRRPRRAIQRFQFFLPAAFVAQVCDALSWTRSRMTT